MNQENKIHIHKSNWGTHLEIFLKMGNSVVKDITLEPHVEHCCYEPTFSIDHKAGQQLMDDLWAAGLRPTEAKGGESTLMAVENHLQDMRTLVQSVANNSDVNFKDVDDDVKRT